MDEETLQPRLDVYRQLSRAIGLGRKLNHVLERVVDALVSTLPVQEVAIALAEGVEARLRVRASRGWSQEAAADELAGMDLARLATLIPEGRPFFIPRAGGRPQAAPPPSAPAPARSSLRLLGAIIGPPDQAQGLLLVDRLFAEGVDPRQDMEFLADLAQVLAQFMALGQDLREALGADQEIAPSWGPHDRHALRLLALSGQSLAIRHVRKLLEKVAPSKAAVLLQGEAGVGKLVAAQFIHRHSDRVGDALVRANFAAWPESRLEAMLFGCEPGACPEVTGPLTGRLETAHGGTIYLEGIERLGPPLQARLLRLLQEHELERLGGSHAQPADVRVVAGCQGDLRAAVDQGRLREDLYYRLNVFPVRLPSLRERAEDIPHLLDRLLDILAEELGRRLRLTPRALDRLCAYHWPGNLREMTNLMERLAILGEHTRLDLAEISPLLAPQPQGRSQDQFEHSLSRLEEMERREVVAALERNNWVQSHAARELGLTLRQIGYRIKKYGLARSARPRADKRPPRPGGLGGPPLTPSQGSLGV
jgi:Nif-specific regulatory protein